MNTIGYRIRIFLLVVIQAVAIGVIARSWPAAIGFMILAVVGCLGVIQIDVSRDRQVLMALIVALLVALWWQFSLKERYIISSIFLSNNLGILGAHYFLTLQILQMYFRHPRIAIAMIPLFGVVTMVAIGDVIALEQRHKSLYFALSMLLTYTSLLCFAGPSSLSVERKIHVPVKRGLLMAATMAFACVIAVTTAMLLRGIESAERSAFRRAIDPITQTIGYHTSIQLGSVQRIKTEQEQNIALRIYAESPPNYLRGHVYTAFERSQWSSDDRFLDVHPQTPPPDCVETRNGGMNWFSIEAARSPAFHKYDIWPAKAIDKTLLLPERTNWIAAAADKLLADRHGAAELAGDPIPSYQTFVSVDPVTEFLPPELRQECTKLPKQLDVRIIDLAQKTCLGQTSAMAKIHAITNHLLNRYEYDLGIQIPSGADPLTYFLLADPPPAAHCEYFASGAAVLLRAVGVPCRYVTGAVAWEQHPHGDYWIVRNRDAHAWVEAYDDERGWVTVEATPAIGLPHESAVNATGMFRSVIENLLFHSRRLLNAIKSMEWRVILAAMVSFAAAFVDSLFGSLAGIAVLIVLAVYVLARVRKRYRRRESPECDPTQLVLRQANELLTEMDRRLQKKQIVRAKHETLNRFANRLESLAKSSAAGSRMTAETIQALHHWYTQFSKLRYGRRMVTEEDIVAIRQSMPVLS